MGSHHPFYLIWVTYILRPSLPGAVSVVPKFRFPVAPNIGPEHTPPHRSTGPNPPKPQHGPCRPGPETAKIPPKPIFGGCALDREFPEPARVPRLHFTYFCFSKKPYFLSKNHILHIFAFRKIDPIEENERTEKWFKNGLTESRMLQMCY